jgi:hypothetical protein
MPATVVLVFVIFVDPCLVSEPSCSGNHPGPMKLLTTITLQGSHKTAQGGLDPIASRSAADGRPRQSIPFGIPTQYLFALLQGWAKRKRAHQLSARLLIKMVGTALSRLCPPYALRSQ